MMRTIKLPYSSCVGAVWDTSLKQVRVMVLKIKIEFGLCYNRFKVCYVGFLRLSQLYSMSTMFCSFFNDNWLNHFMDRELCTTAKWLDLDCADCVLLGIWICYFSDRELCTTAKYLDLVYADYIIMGNWFSHLNYIVLCSTAKWIDLVCADCGMRWYMIGQDLVWFHFVTHCYFLLHWILDESLGPLWYLQVCIGINMVMMIFFCLTSHISIFYKPYTLFPCSRFFPQGFVGQGFLMRYGLWVITYLVFILFKDCTRSVEYECILFDEVCCSKGWLWSTVDGMLWLLMYGLWMAFGILITKP